MNPRLVKIVAVGLALGGLIYFAPQEIHASSAAAYFFRRLGWAARTPHWGFVQIGALHPLDIGLLGIAALIAAITGGAFGVLVCLAGALPGKPSYRLTMLFALFATACFVWAPYQLGYLQVEKPGDLISAGTLPYFVLAVFTMWLLFQNLLRFRSVDRTLKTSLVTLGGSIVAVLISIPAFFYSLALGLSVHEMIWPARHLLE
jgi:hypothetical protein